MTRMTPSGATAVEKSATTGASPSTGQPTAIGLVEMRPSRPPKAATQWPDGAPLQTAMPTSPGFAKCLWIGADPPGVAEVAAVGHGDAGLPREGNKSLDHPHADDLAEAASSIDAEARRAARGDRRLRRRIDDARLDLGKILRECASRRASEAPSRSR